MPTRSYRALLFGLALFGFVADQASKYATFNALYVPDKLSGERDIVPGVFKLHIQFDPEGTPCDCKLAQWNGPVPPHVNKGALWSLGRQFADHANLFFTVVSFLAATGITLWAIRRRRTTDLWLCVALGLVLGGTFGNLFDRIVFGGVRDFLHFYLINWPIFNVADCCLVVGAGVLLTQAIFGKREAAVLAVSPSDPREGTFPS